MRPIRRHPFLAAGAAALTLAPLVAMASSGDLALAALPVAALLGSALVAAGAYFAAGVSRLVGERRSGLARSGTPAAAGC